MNRKRLPKPSKAQPRTGLRPWHARFAFWYVEQPVTPGLAEQIAAGEGFANVDRDPTLPRVCLTEKKLRTLKEREDFQGLVRELEKGGIEAARAKFLSHLPEIMDLHVWGARRSKEKDDTRALASYTVPALDRVLPKREGPFLQQTFHVELSAKRLESIEQARPIIEAELLPPPADPDEVPAPTADAPLTLEDAMRYRRQHERLKPANDDAFREP
jgi:hypothetical protein